MWRLVEDFLPRDVFSEVSLYKAKDRLWHERKNLHDKIRFSDSILKNDVGNAIKAATGSPASDLYEDEGITHSVEAFMEHDAYCDSHNIWFKLNKSHSKDEQREIHVLISGEVNEFAVTAHCSSQDYNYVLDQLRQLNH